MIRKLEEVIILKNRFFKVFNDRVVFNEKNEGTHLKIEQTNKQDGIAILPVLENGNVLLIKNYRYSINKEIEYEELSIELSKNHEVLVLADQHNKSKDALYDVNNKNNFLINRIGGLKFFRKRKKLSELKKYLDTKKVSCIIGDSWKSFELSIDIIRALSITTISLVHGNEIITAS